MPALVATPSPRSRAVKPASVTLARDPGELSGFLPPKSDPDYLWVLSELVCDDLSQHWAGGHRRLLKDYRETFPELFQNQTVLQPIADQEYQLRKQAGDRPNPAEYRDEFGIEPPSVVDCIAQTPMPVSIATIAQVVTPVRPFIESNPRNRASESFDDYESVHPHDFPKVGEVFQGFLLRDLLGKGSFAQVYLADQVGLSSRAVALKVTRRLGREANRLARLQHANIVPIFSFHASDEWQAICMPFFGRQTLDQIVRHVRESRSLPKTGQEVFSTVAAQANETVDSVTPKPNDSPGVAVKPTEAASRGELRDVLSHLSFVDAAILVAAQITDGLIHAHSLNILHLDLKPANVLLSEHGQPMLLDFNLAFDREREQRVRFGGTIPYMAPEQLIEMMRSRELQATGQPADAPRVSLVDARTDLFAVGVMLFELLTGQLPYPSPPKKADAYAFAMEARTRMRPSARLLNPAVPVEIDAIICKLLSPSMAGRYASATSLREDLLNHLEHRPLIHVRAGGLASRIRKWHKRHPGAVIKLLAAGACTIALAAGAWGIRKESERESAVVSNRVETARGEFARLRIDLAANPESPTSERGIQSMRDLLTQFGISQGADLRSSTDLRRLASDERDRFLADVHDLATLAAYSEGVRGIDRQTEIHVANWLSIANVCGAAPAANSPRGLFLEGVKAFHDGRMTDAGERFDAVVKVEPSNAAAQFLFGITLLDRYQYSRACERFEMAAALAPGDARAPYNRGLILAHLRKYAAADSAFSEAIRRDTTMSEAWLNRAQSRIALGRLTEALADCRTAIERGGVTYRAVATKVDIFKKMNADADWKSATAELNKATPRTSSDYLTRGNIHADNRNFTAALLDYRTASTLNPRYAAAWNNQASILGECLHETDQAIAAMDRAVESNPQNGELYLGRAVLHARAGQRDAAHADINKGLILTDHSLQTYQSACAYALTSRTHPDDAEKAVAALRQAVRDGFRDLDILTKDKDIDPIRNRDDVRRILTAVGSLID